MPLPKSPFALPALPALLLACAVPACGTPLDPVDDTASDTAGDADTDADTDADVDDFPYGSTIHDFGITLDEAALASLEADPAVDVHATFTYEAESYDVGLHLKGSSGSFRDMTGKAAFKIDFHQWEEDQRFHDLKRLTLNNMVQDASMSAEHAAYKLFENLGVPAPRHGYSQVSVNGELFGLYGVVETMDGQFVSRNFEDETGNLYEGGYGADVKHGREDNFTVQQQGEPADRADLIALIDAVDVSTAGTYYSVLSANFDIDPLLDVWAAELVVADLDGYTTLANNFLLYYAPTTARWTMIPWGPDQSFVGDLDVHDPYYGDLAIKCAASVECAARLDERIQHVLDVWESSDLEGFVAAETVNIESACRSDPRSPWGDYGCRDAQEAMRVWTEARPGVVSGMLSGS